MKDPHMIIKRPLVTEKSTRQRDEENKVVFEVSRGASKTEIKRAVEEIFKVKVLDVKTIILPGKVKRFGRFVGKTSSIKKAILKLRPGDKIEFFEGV